MDWAGAAVSRHQAGVLFKDLMQHPASAQEQMTGSVCIFARDDRDSSSGDTASHHAGCVSLCGARPKPLWHAVQHPFRAHPPAMALQTYFRPAHGPTSWPFQPVALNMAYNI